MLIEESTKKLEKIDTSFITKFQSLVKMVSKLEKKDDFQGTHYKLLFGDKIGVLNNVTLEALGVSKPKKEKKSKDYYDRCQSLVSQITICIHEWNSFWKSPNGKKKVEEDFKFEVESHEKSCSVSDKDWPEFAKNAAKNMYAQSQGYRLEWCQLYTDVLDKLSEPIKNLSLHLNKLK